MILGASLKLEAVLAAAVAANQPEVTVDYVDWNEAGEKTNPATFRVALNSNTDVTILAAPTQNPIREVIRVSIYNKDTASVTVTVKTDDGTERIICKATLLTLETLNFEAGRGWYAVDANGNTKDTPFPGITTGSHASTWTWDGSGGSTGSITLTWQKIGNFVTLNIPTLSATTGTGSTQLVIDTALPASIRPAATQGFPVNSIVNNTAQIDAAGLIGVATSGVLNLVRDNASTAFTNSAAAGTSSGITISYYTG